jgi:two-component system CheB/CheR fusion protein
MAKEGLLYGLRSALHAAQKTHDTVRKTGLQVRSGSTWTPVSVEVVPLNANGRMHYLVLFDDGRRTARAPQNAGAAAKKAATKEETRSKVDFLRRELAASRDYLQSVIQELEAANEELQSANEEILSSNEELQSTNEELDTAKEELQSTNEELNTVNEELHARNEELSRLNSDLVNLLASVQIAIVIVSADLRIRRFTPMAEKVLNLITADADRQIGHINPNIVGANIEQLIADCIETISPIEREVQDRRGRWYSLRVRPYRSLENKIDGAVVTLFDIDESKQYEESIRAAIALGDEILALASQPVAVVDSDLRIRSASGPFAALFGMSSGDSVRQRPLTDFARSDAAVDVLRDLAAGHGAAPPDAPIVLQPSIQAGAPIRLSVRVCPPYDRSTKRVLLLTGVPAPDAKS